VEEDIMATISLRDYNQQINTLIVQGYHDEAVFHCTNILKSYPKCVDTYRNLGKTLLESKKYTEALEVFSKVLAVYPDDFISHTGLSEIFKEQQEIDKAIWHMEHSFESQPSSMAVQDELKRLFAIRDGVPPSKIRLTRGALIRMYARGELYQQAIAEALSSLEADNDRIDIKLLLAKMYQSSGSIIEAADTCIEILEQLPYCYEANRIMHEIHLLSENADELSIYAQRMSEVDPYFGLIDETHISPQAVPSESIILDKPDYIGTESSTEDIPEWARQIGLTWMESMGAQTTEPEFSILEDNTQALITEETLPSAELSGSNPSDELMVYDDDLSGTESNEVEANSLESLPHVEDDLPDWIAKAGWIRAHDEEVNSTPSSDVSSLTEPLSEIEGNAAPAEDLPDWLKSLNPENLSPRDNNSTIPVNSIPGTEDSNIPDIPSITNEEIDKILSDEGIFDSDIMEPHTNMVEEATEENQTMVPNLMEDDFSVEPVADQVPDLPDWLKDLDLGVVNPPEPEEVAAEWKPSFNTIDDDIGQVISDSFIAESQEDLSNIEQLSDETLLENSQQEEGFVSPLDKDLENQVEEFDVKIIEPPVMNEDNPQIDALSELDGVDKTQVPSWVQKILGTTAPVISPVIQSNQIKEIPPDEALEPLLTELPGGLPEEGAISDDVNLELIAWLEDINPDDAMETPTSKAADEEFDLPTPLSETPGQQESSEITFENLSDPTIADSSDIVSETAVGIEDEALPLPDDNVTLDIDDRLSSLLDQEIAHEQVVEFVQPVKLEAVINSDIEKAKGMPTEEVDPSSEFVTKLVNEKKFAEISEVVSDKSLSDVLMKELNTQVLAQSEEESESFALWKAIGDINIKLTALDKALDAYKKAETLLFRD